METPVISTMRCRVLGISDRTEWTFLEVQCSDGVTGFGEASINGAAAALRAHAGEVANRLSGRIALPNVVQELAGRRAGGMVQRAVVSAVEQALWDAQGQRLGLPVATLLGGAVRDRVPVYANINRRTRDRSPEGFAESARRALAAGYRHVKLAPFDGVGEGGRIGEGGKVEAGLRCIDAAIEAVGAADRVLVDCHWRFDGATAFRVLDFAAERGLFWLECPVPEGPAFHPVLQRLKDAASGCGLRLAGLEKCLDPAEVWPHLRGGHYDAVMPDVKYIGGLGATRAVAEMAACGGVDVAPHNPTGPVCHMASLSVAATLSNLLTLEVQFDETPHFAALAGGLTPVEGGTMRVPSAPGLGIVPDPDLMDDLELRET